MNIKLIFAIFPFLIGCESSYDVVKKGYDGLCSRQPDSMSCIYQADEGIIPDFEFVSSVGYEMYSNFTYATDMEVYGVSDYWVDNINTSIPLIGDCDDIALTFISRILIDGVKPSNIRLVASGAGGKVRHIYAKVMMDNGKYFDFNKIDKYNDMLYMQYDNIGVFVK